MASWYVALARLAPSGRIDDLDGAAHGDAIFGPR